MCQNMGRYTDLHLVTKANMEQKTGAGTAEQEQTDWNGSFICLLAPWNEGASKFQRHTMELRSCE